MELHINNRTKYQYSFLKCNKWMVGFLITIKTKIHLKLPKQCESKFPS